MTVTPESGSPGPRVTVPAMNESVCAQASWARRTKTDDAVSPRRNKDLIKYLAFTDAAP